MAEHKLSNYLADDDSTTGPGTEEAAASCVEDRYSTTHICCDSRATAETTIHTLDLTARSVESKVHDKRKAPAEQQQREQG